MAQHDMNIANQSFPSFRTDLNNALSAINTMHSGTSRPSGAAAGLMWLDVTSASSPTIKFFDGSDDISFATIDYSANTVNFLDSTVVADIVGDTSPQLGGQLDVNGNAIGDGTRELLKFIETASAVNEVTVTNSATGNAPELSASGDDTNIDLKLTPKGSGKLNLDGIKFPNADGNANEVLTTDGSGNLSFASAGGGINWQSSVVTGSTHTASANQGIWINTTSNACTLTLPGSPSVGDELVFSDFARTWQSNAVTLNLNGSKFQGNTTPAPVYDTQRETVHIVYSGSTQGWIPINDGAVALETPQSYTADFLCIAGGASGGFDTGGGGGAGGYRNSYSSETSGGGGSSETSLSLSPTVVYTITVGAGGATETSTTGNDGNDSSISGSGLTTITSVGGGGGYGSGGSPSGNDGGSGGGGASPNHAGGSGTANQGFDGGTATPGISGGGGGAGEAGNTDGNGHGGDGLASSITGTPVTRAGGGSGGGNSARPGGDGGGGNSTHPTGNGTAGTVNTGSGGGGGAYSLPRNGGAGGSGVVILRVPTASYPGTTSGSPTVGTSGSDTILTFTGSGTYTA